MGQVEQECVCKEAVNQSVAVGTTSTRLLGPNQRRRGLIFSPTNLNRCSIAFGQAAVVASGYTIQPGTQPPMLTFATLGLSITGDVFAIFESAGETMGFIEVMA